PGVHLLIVGPVEAVERAVSRVAGRLPRIELRKEAASAVRRADGRDRAARGRARFHVDGVETATDGKKRRHPEARPEPAGRRSIEQAGAILRSGVVPGAEERD